MEENATRKQNATIFGHYIKKPIHPIQSQSKNANPMVLKCFSNLGLGTPLALHISRTVAFLNKFSKKRPHTFAQIQHSRAFHLPFLPESARSRKSRLVNPRNKVPRHNARGLFGNGLTQTVRTENRAETLPIHRKPFN